MAAEHGETWLDLAEGAAVSWVLAGEQVDVGLAQNATEVASARVDDAFNRVVCELVELLSLGETGLCTLVPQGLSCQRLTLNLFSAL